MEKTTNTTIKDDIEVHINRLLIDENIKLRNDIKSLKGSLRAEHSRYENLLRKYNESVRASNHVLNIHRNKIMSLQRYISEHCNSDFNGGNHV